MAFMITEECINCGACEPECPNQAISAGEERYLIDQAKCTECVGHHDSSACASVCPVDACVHDPDVKESREELMIKFHKLTGK
jgi:ferredoxin